MNSKPLSLILKPVYIISILLLFSCNDSSNNSNKEKNTQGNNNGALRNIKSSESFPFDLIKQKSVARKRFYDLSKINFSKLKKIDSTLFKNCFEGTKLDHKNILKYESTNDYFFFDYKDSDSVFFCSIVEYISDYYEFHVYHLTINKIQKKIVQADLIAAQGGEGGYGTSDILEYNSKGNELIVTSSWSEYESDHISEGIIKTKFLFTLEKTVRKILSDNVLK